MLTPTHETSWPEGFIAYREPIAQPVDSVEARTVAAPLTTAERAECGCPELCPRDHDRD